MEKKELDKRLAIDFTLSFDEVLCQLQEYNSNIDAQDMQKWQSQGMLETREINGKKYFFKASVRNVLRLDAEMRRLKVLKDGYDFPDKTIFLKTLLPKLVEQHSIKNHFEMQFELKLKDACSARVWLPFPLNIPNKQNDVKLLICSENEYQLCTQHSSGILYSELEKTRSISETFEFSSQSDFIETLRFEQELPCDIDFTPYLVEQLPHVVIQGKVKELAESVVQNKHFIYDKALLIFNWMSDHLKWASAREYSTIECIPEYVLDVMHGDCGQVTLLFMSLCRSVGIPVRWQSGFMLHTGYENLHDWCEVYFPGVGWRSVDVSFGRQDWSLDNRIKYFYFGQYDGYRCIINTECCSSLIPSKNQERSDPVDFQRGEVESIHSNLYYDAWNWDFIVKKNGGLIL